MIREIEGLGPFVSTHSANDLYDISLVVTRVEANRGYLRRCCSPLPCIHSRLPPHTDAAFSHRVSSLDPNLHIAELFFFVLYFPSLLSSTIACCSLLCLHSALVLFSTLAASLSLFLSGLSGAWNGVRSLKPTLWN